MENLSVFRITVSSGKSMFGVLTNVHPKRLTCNIYNYAGLSNDHVSAMASDILIYDLTLTGAEFPNRWQLSEHRDHSEKGQIKDPYFVFGIPPSKLIKIDDPVYSRTIRDAVELEELLRLHQFLGFNLPKGNEIVIEEAYLYGRRHTVGQHLANSALDDLVDFFNVEAEQMSDFQRQNFINRWGAMLGIK